MISPLSRESNGSSYKMCMIENHQPRTCCLIPFSNEFSLETNYISLTRIASLAFIRSWVFLFHHVFHFQQFLSLLGPESELWTLLSDMCKKAWKDEIAKQKNTPFSNLFLHMFMKETYSDILCFILELTLFTWWAYQAHDQLVRIHVIT